MKKLLSVIIVVAFIVAVVWYFRAQYKKFNPEPIDAPPPYEEMQQPGQQPPEVPR